MNDKKKISLREGLWSETPSPHLLAHTCSNCGEIFFPRKENGICTYCHGTDLKELDLSTKGTVHAFSVVMLRPPGGYYHGDVPYALGQVKLPEGVLIDTLFTGCDPEEIKVGQDVELKLEKLHEDEEGNEIITYKFQPVAS